MCEVVQRQWFLHEVEFDCRGGQAEEFCSPLERILVYTHDRK
jgi:hypothetical protein